MLRFDCLTTEAIRSIFTEEIKAAGGTVSDVFDDETRLFARSLLPRVREIRPRDDAQGGVALRATGSDVWVHPYVFRQVCSNGAIAARAIQSRHIDHLDWLTVEEAAERIGAAVRSCCAEDAFTSTAEQMQSAAEAQADVALNLLPLLSRMSTRDAPRLFAEILDRFLQDGDRSRYGLMNAVTSVARDTSDPELRWRLEEIGAEIPLARVPDQLQQVAREACVVAG